MEPKIKSPFYIGRKINKMPARQKMLVIAVAGIAFIAIVLGLPNNPYSLSHEFANKKFSSENVTLVDNNKSVPAGFLSGVPIETANVIQSETLNYPDRKVVLYNVTYNSAKTMEELYSIYNKYFTANKFAVQVLEKDQKAYRLEFTSKTGSQVFVTVTPQQGGNLILVSGVVK